MNITPISIKSSKSELYQPKYLIDISELYIGQYYKYWSVCAQNNITLNVSLRLTSKNSISGDISVISGILKTS